MDILKTLAGIVSGAGNAVGGVVQGAGDILGGVGDHLGTGLKMVRDNERARLTSLGQNQQIQQTNAKMEALQIGIQTAKQYGGLTQPEGKTAFISTMKELGYPDMAEKFASLNVAKTKPDSSKLAKLFPEGSPARTRVRQNIALENGMGSVGESFVSAPPAQPKLPLGVTPEQMGQFNQSKYSVKPGKGSDPLDRLGKLINMQDKNLDASYKPINQGVADIIAGEISKITGTKQSSGDEGNKITLADMISSSSQDYKRSMFDDTVSPDNVKLSAKNYVETLKAQGVDEAEARKLATKEYGDLMAADSGIFQKYPKMDIAKLFSDEDTRKEAINTDKVVVDTGDGVKTTPTTLGQLQFNTPQEQEDFLDLEKEVAAIAPEINMRTIAKNPTNYQDIKNVLQSVRSGKITAKKAAELIKEAFGG